MSNFTYQDWCALTEDQKKAVGLEADKELFLLRAERAEARVAELENRIKRINVWAECDKCECLFIPGGKGAETTCATCLKEEQAEVDRLIGGGE